MLATEDVDVEFADDGLDRVAELAWHVNEATENIGARRLHTVMERVLEDISFGATECDRTTIVIDADYVNKHVGELAKNEDLSRYIL